MRLRCYFFIFNSKAPGDSHTVVHFVIEFKDKGVHLHNLTAALARENLGKLTLLPSLGQVGEFAEKKCSACLVICLNKPSSLFQKVISPYSKVIYPSILIMGGFSFRDQTVLNLSTLSSLISPNIIAHILYNVIFTLP